MSKLYYTPPPILQFNELKFACMELWKEVDTDNDKFGYATEKINRIKDIGNVEDNSMYMVAMFDINNQFKLAEKLSDTTRNEVRIRMIDGGSPEEYIMF